MNTANLHLPIVSNTPRARSRTTRVGSTLRVLAAMCAVLGSAACGSSTVPLPDVTRPCIPNDGGTDYDAAVIVTRPMGQIGIMSLTADREGMVSMTAFGDVFDVVPSGDVEHCGRGYIVFQDANPVDGGALVTCTVPMTSQLGSFSGTTWNFNFRAACQEYVRNTGEPFGRTFNVWVVPASHSITNDMMNPDGTCSFRCFYVGIIGPTMNALQSMPRSVTFPSR